MKFNADIDRFIKEVYENGEYGYLFKRLTVIDVGCNVGAFSLWIQPLASEIYAIDISEQNIQNLNQTIDDNLIKNIKTFMCGISGKTEIRTVTESGNSWSGGWSLGKGSLTVPTFSLGYFMAKEGIEFADIVKIDTEGAEVEILSALDFPWGKVNTICGELHHDLSTNSRREVRPIFEEHGYRYFEFPNNQFVGRL